MGGERADGLNLKQVAATLGVHYMTAYRYVRTGRLPARRAATGWLVDPDDLAGLACRAAGEGAGGGITDWAARLAPILAAGDEPAAWRIIEQALAAGQTPAACYLDVIVAAIEEVSSRCREPEGPVAEEYLAVATATRLVARLGGRFRRPGRSRGTVVFGAAVGEHHLLAISVVADLVRLEGFDCLELGADVPAQAFADAAASAHRLVAVGIGITRATNLDAVRRTVAALRAHDPDLPVLLGGQASADPSALARIGADAVATDGRHAVRILNELVRSRRMLWPGADDAGPGPARRHAPRVG